MSISPRSIFGFMVVAVIISQLVSCKHDPFMPDGPIIPIDTTDNPIDTMDNPIDTMGVPCDPDVVYYEYDIQPLLNSNCAFSGCHDAATAQDGVDLSSYERVIATADVRAFDLEGSDLYEVITDSDPDKRMPPSPRPALSSAQINLISQWILSGAENLECDPNARECDTEDRSYLNHIRPILQNTCVGCHSGSTPSGAINLSTYDGVRSVALNGRLIGAISHDPDYSAMPQGGAMLPECEILQIQAWIDAGAPNN